ncbi:MAG: N-acetyltransferase [Planctomycetota bacterium]
MKFSVIEVHNHQTKKLFIHLPWRIYPPQADHYWVPPIISEEWKLLDPATNPFYQHADVSLFLALDEKRQPVGRIAAIVNHQHLKFHQEKIGFFGFFESINSPEAAQLLLDTARHYLQSKGMTAMRGPMNFSINDTCGLLIEGFDSPPTFLMTYNPSYYPELFEKCGLAKLKDLYAYYMNPDTVNLPQKINRITERIQSRNEITVRHPDMKNLDREVKIIQEIYNRAWEDNWGALPMTDAEIQFMLKGLKPLLVPEFLLIAEVGGQPTGFSLTLPDYNQAIKKMNGRLWPFGFFRFLLEKRKIKKLRMITMGVVKEFRKRGIDVIFYLESIKQAQRLGYREAELSWVLEDNDLMNRTIQSLGARIYKKYRIYQKVI